MDAFITNRVTCRRVNDLVDAVCNASAVWSQHGMLREPRLCLNSIHQTLNVITVCVDSLKTLVNGSLALAPTAAAGVAFRPVPALSRKSFFVWPSPSKGYLVANYWRQHHMIVLYALLWPQISHIDQPECWCFLCSNSVAPLPGIASPVVPLQNREVWNSGVPAQCHSACHLVGFLARSYKCISIENFATR